MSSAKNIMFEDTLLEPARPDEADRMFEDTLLESGRVGEAHRRGVTTLVVLVAQCLAVAGICVLSLRYTHVLPEQESAEL